MRSIQVVNVRWFNATAWYGMYLSRLLLEAGHETLVLVLPDTLAEAKGREWNLPMRRVPLNTVTPWGIIGLYAELKALVREFRPQVVNCHRGEAFILWGLLKKELGSFRLVRTRGDQRPPKNSPVNRWLHNTASDAVITTNSRMTRHFRDNFRTPPGRLHQILGGVDKSVFFPDSRARALAREELGYADRHFVVGLLGRFDRVKGQRELIRALGMLRARGLRDIRLLLLGFDSATPEGQVRDWLREAGMEEAAIITGKRNDIPRLLNALDLGAAPSLWSETIARAALEIMACGVPLIASDVGVMPDLLDADALLPPDDVEALARRVEAVYLDSGLRENLRQAQTIRMAGLDGRDFLAQTLAVYESI